MSARACVPYSAVVLVLVLALPALATAGQWPHERDGIVLGFSLGGGSADATVLDIEKDRESGFGGGGRIGYAFNPEWAVGLAGTAWTKEVNGETWTFGVAGPTVTYYPGGGGFFVRGGVGVGSIEYKIDTGSVTVTVSDSGFGFLLGTGYEWRLSRKFALGPNIDYGYGKITYDSGILNDDVSLNFLNATVGLNWYF